ncbi:MAG: alpha amylase C-terminal domain-containing protein [Spirochaetaceae bacterium]|jgi:1,4-alpha-glucan branching enzyme|nr:alpha amylase C-terminal domain-containing protein [Spirochaetaceae bacterium]
MANITFLYIPGVFGPAFEDVDALLKGSWSKTGAAIAKTEPWTVSPMSREPWEDGGVCFRAVVQLDSGALGEEFYWGVSFRGKDGRETWAIASEIDDPASNERTCRFRFNGIDDERRYYLTHCRRLGANKVRRKDGSWGARFAVWAPHARAVELVFGAIWNASDADKKPVGPDVSTPKALMAGGYIAADGSGVNPLPPSIPMVRNGDGIWETGPDAFNVHPDFKNSSFDALNHRPYMFKITREDGFIAYRTDLYSRCQIGSGSFNPNGGRYEGLTRDLRGLGSCSVTVDPEKITKNFEEAVWPEKEFIDAAEFWKDEFTGKKLPQSCDDLIIYELHLGALGFGRNGPGTLKDALALLDHVEAMNINAIELLPLSEFGGDGVEGWGYSTSHYFAIEYSGGGRDQFKFFIKECHRRGIAVIMDVVYNHYSQDGERAEFDYDASLPQHNIYYWYEGKPWDYSFPEGGYLDNMSTGWAPRFYEKMVRKLFISSAVSLLREFHVDGFRLDQTTSMHGYNALHSNGNAVGTANMFGAKFLREFGRTVRMFKPGIFLMAEDHSDWDEVTKPVEEGGMGFDARWHSSFYHNLMGDTDQGDAAKLIYRAATSPGSPLPMDNFAGVLSETAFGKVVYSESHDEAGNSSGPFLDPDWNGDAGKQYTSARGIVTASNAAPLIGDTRKYAEARCRFAWGITALSAGVPMFLFGEEVGAQKRFKYNAVLKNKEDIAGMAKEGGEGRFLYRFYSDVNALRRAHTGLRSRSIEVIHAHNSNRVIAFRRWDENESFLIVASLADAPYDKGYVVHGDNLKPGLWAEEFNSDSALYGGGNVGNSAGVLRCANGDINPIVPFAGFVVLRWTGEN